MKPIQSWKSAYRKLRGTLAEDMRDDGHTFEAIGHVLGVSVPRAREVYLHSLHSRRFVFVDKITVRKITL